MTTSTGVHGAGSVRNAVGHWPTIRPRRRQQAILLRVTNHRPRVEWRPPAAAFRSSASQDATACRPLPHSPRRGLGSASSSDVTIPLITSLGYRSQNKSPELNLKLKFT